MTINTIFKFIFQLLILLLVLNYAVGSGKEITSFLNSLKVFISNSDAPVADFTFSPDNVCADTPIKFTNLSIGDELSYSWDFGDGSDLLSEKDPSHIFINATGGGTRTFIVNLTVTDKDGISTSASKTVTVKEIPSLSVSSDTGPPEIFENLEYFVFCQNQPYEFVFNNNAGSTEKNILYEINWGDGSPDFSGENWTELKHTYVVGIYNITYAITSENGCKISRIYGVFIGSNPAVGIGNPGNTNVCEGETLTFPITGTENNPPGTKYSVTFSDGSPVQVFDHPAPASVSHTFISTSCGSQADGFDNSFSVKIVAENPCSKSQASVVPIYVSEPPQPEIKVPDGPFCVDSDVTIENISELKTEVSNTGNCNTEAKIVWEISPSTGWVLQDNSSLGSRPDPDLSTTWISGDKILVPNFTEPGTYTIKSITGNRCGTREEIITICVIPKPDPSFTLENTEVCGPANVNVTHTSNILGLCGLGNEIYTWSVVYSEDSCGTTSDWEFTAGSDKNSESPSFLFTNPGIYTVRLTIDVSCGQVFKEEIINVVAPPEITISPIPNSCGPTTFTPEATVIDCNSATPTYKWTFEGGTPETSVSLDPGPVTFSTPGTKKITLEVTSSCGTATAEKTFSINEIHITDAGGNAEICNGEGIQLNGTTTGGTGPFTYQWSSNPASSISGSTTATPTVKPSQTTLYKLTVRNQITGCSSSDELEIKVIPAPIIQFDLPNQEICSGDTSQVINLSSLPSGESIIWTSEAKGVVGVRGNGTNQIPAQTLINTTGRPIDVVYTALVPSPILGNCLVIPAKYLIRVNPELIYSDEILSVCSDHPIDFKPSNNVEGSTFTWTVSDSPGISGATNSTQATTSIKQQLQNTTKIPLEVTYFINPSLGPCNGNPFQLVLTVQPAPSLNFSEEDQIICTGANSKAVIFTSDLAGATFSWTAVGQGVDGVITSGSGNEIPSQLLENKTRQPVTVEFKVSATTHTGGSCAGTPKTYRITVNPTIELGDQASDFSGFGISCFGANDGGIKLNPTGGNGVYTYSWAGPDGFSSNLNNIENLNPGSYEVRVVDELGCSVIKSFQITEPSLIMADVVSTTDILCAGDESGAIEISVSGGVSSLPYLFEWKRNGIAFPATTQNLSGVPAGLYEVMIFDSNRCFKTLSEIQLTEPPIALVINYKKTNISCYGANDGALDLDVSGGMPPYTISWSFGSSQSSFDNLGPGDYTLTVADQSSCTRTQTITIEDAPLFKTEPDVKQISCFGEKDGSIKLNLEGGVGTPTIRWDHGPELENLFNLAAGFYGVSVNDETNCEIRSEFNIVEPGILQLESLLTDALDCINPQSGAITLGISGGTPPYSILWSNGQTSEQLTGITSGQYAVSIIDASGCTINQSFEIKRPQALSIVAFKSNNVQCEPRYIEEEIKITISGGIAPYSVNWSGGTISSDLRTMTTRTPGIYEVVITDGRGCITSQSFEVENLEVIPETKIESTAFEQYNSYLVGFEIQFLNKSFGQITSYFWDFGDGNESLEENPKHIYSAEGEYEIILVVTDIFGCKAEVKKKISVLDYYLVVPNVFTPNNDGINDYFFPKFINIESLEFWILNKWGEIIFYTDDLNSQGWNGTIEQEVGMPGNYVYKLKFKTLDGRTQSQTDLFMLLK